MNYKKYGFVLILTTLIFASAFLLSNALNDKKVASIKATEDKISIDILSLETQFELLQDSACTSFGGSILSDELENVGDRLSYAESQRGISDADVSLLKKHYSILEIKDYLLTKKLDKQCRKVSPVSILYFYSNQSHCDDCTKQGYVLTKLREDHPELRVYTFDYDIDLNAVKTLISIHKIPAKLPALVIHDKVYSGFQSIEDIIKIAPELKIIASSTASTTASTTRVKK